MKNIRKHAAQWMGKVRSKGCENPKWIMEFTHGYLLGIETDLGQELMFCRYFDGSARFHMGEFKGFVAHAQIVPEPKSGRHRTMGKPTNHEVADYIMEHLADGISPSPKMVRYSVLPVPEEDRWNLDKKCFDK